MITRRGFLAALAGLLAAPALLKPAPDNKVRLSELLDGDSWGPALRKGDVFTIEGVYAVNPLTYRETGHLQRFVVTSDVSDGPYVPIAVIYPSLIVAGPYTTVSVRTDLGNWPIDGIPMRLIRPAAWVPRATRDDMLLGFHGPLEHAVRVSS